MAAQWGSNTLSPGQAAGWYFVRDAVSNFLPALSVTPLSPSFTNDGSFYWTTFDDGIAFPTMRQLGTSAIWVKLSDDGSHLVYFMLVLNYSESTIEYAFLESDL